MIFRNKSLVFQIFHIHVKLQNSFLNENKRMSGWNPKKPTKLDGNDTTTLSHHPYVLCHFAAANTNMLCVLAVC